MIIYENECVGCDLPCLGISCSLVHVTHYYCDICGDELCENEIAYSDGEYIECINCHEEEYKEPEK